VRILDGTTGQVQHRAIDRSLGRRQWIVAAVVVADNVVGCRRHVYPQRKREAVDCTDVVIVVRPQRTAVGGGGIGLTIGKAGTRGAWVEGAARLVRRLIGIAR